MYIWNIFLGGMTQESMYKEDLSTVPGTQKPLNVC